MNRLPYNTKLHILNLMEPEETREIRIASKFWNAMPKPRANGLRFFEKYNKISESVMNMCKFAAMSDNLDLPYEISHAKIFELYEMYMWIPRGLKEKFDLHPIVKYYMLHGDNLCFHRQTKLL